MSVSIHLRNVPVCYKADSAASLARVVELEEQLSAAQQERDLVNEMLQLHKV